MCMNKTENAVLTSSETLIDNELSLLDLVKFVQKNFIILLGGLLLGLFVSLVTAFLLPSEWEATALVRVGQFKNGDNLISIEPSLQVVDRIKSASFQQDVLKNLGLNLIENNTNDDRLQNLKVKLEKSDLINISWRGLTKVEAKNNLSVVVNELVKIHKKKFESVINRWNQELISTGLAMQHSAAESNQLNKTLERLGTSEKTFSENALISNTLLVREKEMQYYRERKYVLEEQLSPERTFPTEILGNIIVSKEPVSPKKTLFAFAGAILGLILAFIFIMIKAQSSKLIK